MSEKDRSETSKIPSIPERRLNEAHEVQNKADIVYEKLDIEIANLLEQIQIEMSKPVMARDRGHLRELAAQLRERFQQQDELGQAAEEHEKKIQDMIDFRDGRTSE